MRDELIVEAGKRAGLSRRKPDETFGWDKERAQAELVEEIAELARLQSHLFAEGAQSLLVVLQAMDAAGKDGVIRSIFTGLNPAGVKVTSFKVPAGREAEQDYLWRVHANCPGKGEIGVFNRSHYEDVLVVRVKGFVPEARWKRRYRHIAEFERILADEGTRIVKLFLHVSKDEQRARLQDRVDDPEERWKFRKGDLDDRALWNEYHDAYEDAIEETSTSYAPWYVIPADRKWVRNLAVAQVLRATLEDMDPQLPPPEEGIEGLVVE